MNSWNPDFSHIYLEAGAADYDLTRKVLNRFPEATVIPVDDYREVFNRPRQHFQQQKRSMKLILAVKKDSLLYRGSENAQDFSEPNFYYSTPVLNCLYNCDYCFLQGMYASANLVVFVNQEAMIEQARAVAANPPAPEAPVLIAISYNTDLLAAEPWLGICRQWIEATRDLDNFRIEIRTKSGNFRALRDLEPTPSTILAWTISPEAVYRRYESGTAPPNVRIRAAREALDRGWNVRLCLDPVLRVTDWKQHYSAFIDRLFRELPPDRLLDVSTGGFRMSGEYFKAIRSRRPESDLYYYPFQSRNGLVKYADEEQAELMETVTECLRSYLPASRLAVWS